MSFTVLSPSAGSYHYSASTTRHSPSTNKMPFGFKSLLSKNKSQSGRPFTSSTSIVPFPTRAPTVNSRAAEDGAPPAYSPGDNQYTPAIAGTNSFPDSITSIPDAEFAPLAKFDTVFLIDDSGSMVNGDRWQQTADVIKAIAPICTEFDRDGVDVWFLHHRKKKSGSGSFKNVKTSADVEAIFRQVEPVGLTPTAERLGHILNPRLKDLAKQKIKPLNIIMITDGKATDDVKRFIVKTANWLDTHAAPSWSVGIQFFQVGNDSGAREQLQDLDDNLSARNNSDMRDMIDTVPYSGNTAQFTGDFILKVVLGSVVRRLDRGDGIS